VRSLTAVGGKGKSGVLFLPGRKIKHGVGRMDEIESGVPVFGGEIQ